MASATQQVRAPDDGALVLAVAHKRVVRLVGNGENVRRGGRLDRVMVELLHLRRVDWQALEGVDGHQDVADVRLGAGKARRIRGHDECGGTQANSAGVHVCTGDKKGRSSRRKLARRSAACAASRDGHGRWSRAQGWRIHAGARGARLKWRPRKEGKKKGEKKTKKGHWKTQCVERREDCLGSRAGAVATGQTQ